jgi:hypothetical protein
MELIDYDGRTFVPVSGARAAGRYTQTDDLVSAEFTGLMIRAGRLFGRADSAGVITAGYSQVMRSGTVISGTVRSVPTVLADGRIRLTENWRRADGTSGVSTIEEVR